MRTIEIISCENAHENQIVDQAMDWLGVEDVLALFDSDPDILTINNKDVYFTDLFDSETNTKVVIFLDLDYGIDEGLIISTLSDFYKGGIFYHCDSVDDKKISIKYRGGKGYFYSLFTNDK